MREIFRSWGEVNVQRYPTPRGWPRRGALVGPPFRPQTSLWQIDLPVLPTADRGY